MNEEKKKASIPASATYQVENRQFIVNRCFAPDKTVSEILTTEITSGLLRPVTLSNTNYCGIIQS